MRGRPCLTKLSRWLLSRCRFQVWALGLERALSMLMGPGGMGPETPASLLRDGGGSGGMIRTECAPSLPPLSDTSHQSGHTSMTDCMCVDAWSSDEESAPCRSRWRTGFAAEMCNK